MENLKPNADLKLDTAHGSRFYFYHHIKHLIPLYTPQLSAISLWYTALSTFYSPLGCDTGRSNAPGELNSHTPHPMLCIRHKTGLLVLLVVGTFKALMGLTLE